MHFSCTPALLALFTLHQWFLVYQADALWSEEATRYLSYSGRSFIYLHHRQIIDSDEAGRLAARTMPSHNAALL